MRSIMSLRFLMEVGTALTAWLGASSVYALEPLDQRAGMSRTHACQHACLATRSARGAKAGDEGEAEAEGEQPESAALLG